MFPEKKKTKVNCRPNKIRQPIWGFFHACLFIFCMLQNGKQIDIYRFV